MGEEEPLVPDSVLLSATLIPRIPRQFPLPTLTSKDSGLFLFPSVRLKLHLKDRKRAEIQTPEVGPVSNRWMEEIQDTSPYNCLSAFTYHYHLLSIPSTLLTSPRLLLRRLHRHSTPPPFAPPRPSAISPRLTATPLLLHRSRRGRGEGAAKTGWDAR